MLHSVDISHTASAASIIFEALHRAIVEGELQEGTPLRQEKIAKMFNSSRIPVREAISRLEQSGLVTVQRYRGAVVSGLTISEMDEVFDIQALLESALIRRAVPRMSAPVIDQAQVYADQLVAAPPAEVLEMNRRFHCALYEAADLPYHLGMVNTSYDRTSRYMKANIDLDDRSTTAFGEHQGILDACRNGDADLASALTYTHVQNDKDAQRCKVVTSRFLSTAAVVRAAQHIP